MHTRLAITSLKAARRGGLERHFSLSPPVRQVCDQFSASTVYCRMILMALLRSGSISLKAGELRYATA